MHYTILLITLTALLSYQQACGQIDIREALIAHEKPKDLYFYSDIDLQGVTLP